MNSKLIFFFSVFVSLMLGSCARKTESITPEIKSITESVYSTGFIKSKNQYEVFGRTNVKIEKMFVTEGMRVKKGDSVFQLDRKNLEKATENARLTLSASEYTRNTNKLRDAKTAIEIAKKNLVNDSLQYARQKSLWNDTIGSQVQFEQKQLNYETSKADFEKAKTNYEDLKRHLKLESDQSKINLENAQIMEDDFMIRSEVDGMVYKINKQEGEFINDQEPVAIIGEEEFIIELNIDEKDIVKVKKEQLVIIRMDSYKSQVFEARITTIEPMMSIRTRSFLAEAVFTKRPEELFLNLTVEANIVINTKQEVLTIPRNYLMNDSCVLLEGGTLQKVEVGLMDYDLVEIKSGIDRNTTIYLQNNEN